MALLLTSEQDLSTQCDQGAGTKITLKFALVLKVPGMHLDVNVALRSCYIVCMLAARLEGRTDSFAELIACPVIP